MSMSSTFVTKICFLNVVLDLRFLTEELNEYMQFRSLMKEINYQLFAELKNE